MLLAQLVEARKAVHPRHPQIHQDEIRLDAADERQYRRSGVGFADDLDLRRLREDAPQAFEYEPMIVGNDNPQFSAHFFLTSAV